MLAHPYVGSRALIWTLGLVLATSCKDDDKQGGDGGSTANDTDADDSGADGNDASNDTATASQSASSDGPSSASQSASDADASDPDTSEPDSSGGTDPDTGTPGVDIYDESFDGADGSPWPAPWEVIGTAILDSELDGGRGRMSGQTGITARIALTGFEVRNAEVIAVVEYANWEQQGFGFYVRQNGGALVQTDPPGQGYAVYAEGGYMRALGIWKEIDGVETAIAMVPNAVPGGVDPNTPYVIRFQCMQDGATTTLRAKMWRQDQAEPGAWMVETEDGTRQLQDVSGSFAADIYNYAGTGSVWLHQVTISEL